MFETAAGILKVLLFFLRLWREKDSTKAARMAGVAKEIVDAFKETDKKLQASYLSAAICGINRL